MALGSPFLYIPHTAKLVPNKYGTSQEAKEQAKSVAPANGLCAFKMYDCMAVQESVHFSRLTRPTIPAQQYQVIALCTPRVQT